MSQFFRLEQWMTAEDLPIDIQYSLIDLLRAGMTADQIITQFEQQAILELEHI